MNSIIVETTREVRTYSWEVLRRLQESKKINIKCLISDSLVNDFTKEKEVFKGYDIEHINRYSIFFGDLKFPQFEFDEEYFAFRDIFIRKYMERYLFVSARQFEDWHFMYNMPVKEPYFYRLCNSFEYLLKYFYAFNKKNNISLLIQTNLPHEAGTLLLHWVCKEMGIKTISLYNLVIEGESYVTTVSDIEDVGLFKTSPILNDKPLGIKIKNQYQKDLEYMNRYVFQGQVKKINSGSFYKDAYDSLLNQLYKEIGIKKQSFFKKALSKFINHSEAIVSKEEYLRSQIRFYENLEKISAKDVDLTVKFIYFPLHYQPELTTMPLGEKYQDQLLAIEKLAVKLPKGWEIFIKENPKQHGGMRDEIFFKRLNNIPNSKVISSSVDTYQLMQNCQCVATITGTAGWEAITGGKPVIIFGNAWYYKFDGVFEYNENLDIKNITSYKISHNKIQRQMDLFSKKLFNLPMIHYQIKDSQSFDYKANDNKFYELIYKSTKIN